MSFIVAVMGSWRLLVFVALNVSIVFVNVLNDVATVMMIAASCFELPACRSILISFSWLLRPPQTGLEHQCDYRAVCFSLPMVPATFREHVFGVEEVLRRTPPPKKQTRLPT